MTDHDAPTTPSPAAPARPAPMLPPGLALPGIDESSGVWTDLDIVDVTAPGDPGTTVATLLLYWASYRQRPTGSLPEDDGALQGLLRPRYIAEVDWPAAKELLLRQWTPCSDGRLYRPQLAALILTIWLELALTPGIVDHGSCSGLLAASEACLRRLRPRAEILDRVAAATGRPPRPDIDDRPPDEYDACSGVAAQELARAVRAGTR